jgi:hypothetical protein
MKFGGEGAVGLVNIEHRLIASQGRAKIFSRLSRYGRFWDLGDHALSHAALVGRQQGL